MDIKYQTKNFRVLIIGDPNSIKSVKSFTWISPLPLKEHLQNNQQVYETNSNLNQDSNLDLKNPTRQTSDQASQPSFLENIPDYFHD